MASKITPRAPRLGRKKIFLPNFTLTLLRNEALPPTFASFIVPLNLNKLDLRDYLWNAYGVNCKGVRSYIQMQKVMQDKPNAKRPAPRRWFRPRSIKKMMVEMDQPFVWPKEPEAYTEWDKERYDEVREYQDQQREAYLPQAKTTPTTERLSIVEQAKAMLSGEEKWESTQWEDVGEMQEVEQDIKIDGDAPR